MVNDFHIDWLVQQVLLESLVEEDRVQSVLYWLAKHNSKESKQRVIKWLEREGNEEALEALAKVKLQIPTHLDGDAHGFARYDFDTLIRVQRFVNAAKESQEKKNFEDALFCYLIQTRLNQASIEKIGKEMDKGSLIRLYDRLMDFVFPSKEIIKIENLFNFAGAEICLVSIGSKRTWNNFEVYEIPGHWNSKNIMENPTIKAALGKS